MSDGVVERDASDFVGSSLRQAEALVASRGPRLRVERSDGWHAGLKASLSRRRVNVQMGDDLISAARIG